MMKNYEKYICSNWMWYDRVPEHWSFSRLKYSLDNIIGGGTPDTGNSEYWDDANGIFWVSIADITSSAGYLKTTQRKISNKAIIENNLSVLPKGTLLISIFASLGKVTLLGIDATVNQAILGLIVNENVLIRDFLKYYLMFSESFISYFSSSNTQENLNLTKIKNLPIFLPTTEEQTTIAKYLDEKTAQIDKLIENKRRLIALLKEERSGIINNAVTRGINPYAKLKPSGIDWLGEIPEDWEVEKLKRVTEKITNGFVGATVGILKQEGIRYIQSLHIKDNTIKFIFPYYVSEEWSNNHSRSILKEKDILVVQTGAGTGNIGIVPKEFEGCNCHALIIRIDKKMSDADFIMNALTSDYGKYLTKSIETGALHPHLNSTKICDIELLIPPIEEQKQIVQFIQAETGKIDATVAKIEKEIEYLLEYRTALISEVVTGKIKVV